jgi:RNA polymerase sigma-70 factor (family 1)
MSPDKIYDISDDGLLRSIAKDDRNAFEEIFHRYWSRLYMFAYNILRDKDICEDFIQEIFIDLWERRNISEITNLSSYLYTAVKYKAANHFRKGKINENFIRKWVEFLGAESIEDSLEHKELSLKVEQMINQLPEQRRLIFNLSRKENLSHKEISEKLNISVRTVKNQVSAALRFIRESIGIFILFL